jgi:DoxX-like family
MATETNKAMLWGGRVMSALPVLALVMSSAMKLSHSAMVVEGWSKSGFPAGSLTPIGAFELTCAILYAVPQTTVFGAVLMTGYLGAACATHIQMGELFIAPLAVAILAWVGLFLREPRLRALVPLRKPD